MIDDKKIEAAARRYSEVTDCDKQESLLIEEGFKEGAKWAINVIKIVASSKKDAIKKFNHRKK